MRLRFPRGGAALLIALLAWTTVPAQEAPGPEPAREADQRAEYARLLQQKLLLEREARLKELQLELAGDDAPYLLFDLEEREIRVYVRVTAVRRFPLEAAEIEALDADSPAAGIAGWVDRELTLVAKSGDGDAPERIQPPTPSAESGEAGPEVDPRAVTPELAGLKEPTYPASYTLLYREGVAVRISAGAAPGEGGSWIRRQAERLAAVLVRPDTPAAEEMEPIETWLHLTLPEEQAKALYPAAFTGMRAMIRLPGDPRL